MKEPRKKRPDGERKRTSTGRGRRSAVDRPIEHPIAMFLESHEQGKRRASEDEGCGLNMAPQAKHDSASDMEPDDPVPFGPPEEPEAEEPDEAALDVVEPPARPFPTPAARIRARIGEGIAVHVATGIATLDTNTRGGLIAGRLTIIGGAPDAGKTSFAVQIAHDCARMGYAVAIHCADEDAEGIQFRIGQQVGLALEDLEAGSEDALSRLAEHFDTLPALLVVDQDEDRMTIEDTASALFEAARQHRANRLLLVVDSVQTARARAADHAPSIRERITATATELKRIAKTGGALVIATCELSRAAYRSRNAKDRIEDMAAFKESGAVEYAMNTGLVLRPVTDAEDEVDVSVPKNKRGRRAPFRLRRDPARCAYFEIPMPPDEDEPANKRADLAAAIVAHVREHPGCAVGDVKSAVKGNGKVAGDTIGDLVDRGILKRDGGARGAARLFAVDREPAGDEVPGR